MTSAKDIKRYARTALKDFWLLAILVGIMASHNNQMLYRNDIRSKF